MAQLKRTAPRRWLGNGMGYDPAEYAIVNQYGQAIGAITHFAGRWQITAKDGNNRRFPFFNTFKDARKFALENF